VDSAEAALLGSGEEVFVVVVVVVEEGGGSWRWRRGVVVSCRGWFCEGYVSAAAQEAVRGDVVRRAWRRCGLQDARPNWRVTDVKKRLEDIVIC
jgi:hypothetical protein